MARSQRADFANFPQHVVQRGVDRQATFFCDADYRVYLSYLREASRKHDCSIHAYVLMTNHVHLLMTTSTDGGVGRLMQWLGGCYVRYINASRNRTGGLWEGRYRSSLVDTQQYLLACYRYVELNPVRAQMVEHPEDYPWSSYRRNALGKPDRLIVPHAEYTALGRSAEQRRCAYLELFETEFDEQTLSEIRFSVNRNRPVGTDGFEEKVQMLLWPYSDPALTRVGADSDPN